MLSQYSYHLFTGDKCGKGPGYASPEEAIRCGSRETLMYAMCIVPPSQRHIRHDCMATVDIDPTSPTYCQVRCILVICVRAKGCVVVCVNLILYNFTCMSYKYSKK